MTSQEKILKVQALMMMAAACGVRFDEKNRGDKETVAFWEDVFRPYPAIVVQGAVVGWIHDTRETYGRLPAPGAITERIELILSMDRRRRFEASQARRRAALAGHLERRREARRVYLSAMRSAAALPPAEATAARIVAHQRYSEALVAIDRAISLAASDTAALEASHG